MKNEQIESYIQFAQNIEYPMVVFEADDGRVLYMNYEAELALGRQVEHLAVESGRTMIKREFWETLHNKKSILWHRLRLVADDHEHAVSGLVHETEVDGKKIYMVLFESQMKLGSLVLERVLSQAGIVSIYLAKKEKGYRLEYVSKNINTYGYTSEQLYDNKITFKDFICEQDYPEVDRALRQAVVSHAEELVLECRIFTEARELVPVRVHMHYEYNEYGNFSGVEILMFDLRTEMYQKKEKDYLNHAIDKMKSVVLVKTYKPGKRELTYISPNAAMVGMNVQALQKGYKLTEDYIHPDDREQVIESIYRAIASGITDYVHIYRMVRDDGKQIWVLNELTVNHSADEEAEISFLLTDITEQKMMEQELAVAKEELQEGDSLKEQDNLDYVAIDQSDEEMLKELQEMTEALNGQADYYNVVLDIEGKLLTKPVGPMKDMGQFYDLFERPQFKEQFVQSAERVKAQVMPIGTTFRVDSMEVHMVLAPIILNEKVTAYWVLTAFNCEEITMLSDTATKQWHLASVLAKSFYADQLTQREKRLHKLADMQIERELQARKLMRELVEVVTNKGEAALAEVCHKTALYLDIENIGIYVKHKEQATVEKYYTWNRIEEDSDFFERMQLTATEYESFQELFRDKRVWTADRNSESPLLRGMVEHAGVSSAMFAALTLNDKMKGYVVFADPHRISAFDERDEEVAGVVSNLVCQMILAGRSHLGSGVSRESFLEAYEYVREAVFLKDNRSGDIIYANKAMSKLFGYDVVGMPAKDIVYDELEHYKNMGGMRHRVTHKKVSKWQSYMKELDQIMNIVEIHIDAFGGDYSLMLLKKSKNKNKA